MNMISTGTFLNEMDGVDGSTDDGVLVLQRCEHMLVGARLVRLLADLDHGQVEFTEQELAKLIGRVEVTLATERADLFNRLRASMLEHFTERERGVTIC